MVLFIPLLAAIPTTIGIAEAVSSQRRENQTAAADEKAQMRKFTLECYCDGKGRRAREIHGGKVVVRGGKLWILPSSSPPQPATPPPHPFSGFYIPYPSPSPPSPPPLGLVTTIATSPPTLNWIYIDRATRELKHGNRTQSQAHVVGPWGWEAGEEGGAGGVTCGGVEEGVVGWREGGEGEGGGWEVRWGGEEEGLKVSLERRWVDGGEEEGEGEGEEEEKGRVEGLVEVTRVRGKEKEGGGGGGGG